MAKVTVVISTVAQDFPPGTVGGAFRYQIEGDAVFSQDSTATSVDFLDVAPGSYVASAQLLDDVGNALGAKVSTPFIVEVPNVSLQVPATVTVVLS